MSKNGITLDQIVLVHLFWTSECQSLNNENLNELRRLRYVNRAVDLVEHVCVGLAQFGFGPQIDSPTIWPSCASSRVV
jgi:hypothetical protein